MSYHFTVTQKTWVQNMPYIFSFFTFSKYFNLAVEKVNVVDVVERPYSMQTRRDTRMCPSEPGTYSMDCQ